MKVLDSSPEYAMARAAERANKGSEYDENERKVLVRFERGVDFDTFEGFRGAFLELLNEGSKAWGRRQLGRMEQLGIRQQLDRLEANVKG